MREEFLRSVKCIYKETLDLTEAKNKSKTKRVIVNWKTIVQIKKGGWGLSWLDIVKVRELVAKLIIATIL